MVYTKQDYVERIKNASPTQLVVITFELILVNLEDAKQTGNTDEFQKYTKKAQEFLMQLMTSLNMSYSLSGNLLSIYLYVNKLLHEVYFTKEIEKLDTSIKLLTSLMESFINVSLNDADNHEEMFPNFRYTNGRINEFEIEDINAGFKA